MYVPSDIALHVSASPRAIRNIIGLFDTSVPHCALSCLLREDILESMKVEDPQLIDSPILRRRGKNFATILAILFFALVIAAFVQITHRSLHFILPIGYRGWFVVATHTRHGGPLIFEGIRYICAVPRDGVVMLKGEEAVENMMLVTASYANGDAIARAPETKSNSESKPFLYDGGTVPVEDIDQVHWYFVGTPDDWESRLPENKKMVEEAIERAVNH